VQEKTEMTNWIGFGGKAPRQFGEAYLRTKVTTRKAACWRLLLRPTLALSILALAAPSMHARDLDGRYASQNPELHQWFEGLKSGKGPCCSDADGSAISDADWEVRAGHYWVYIDNEWRPVPDEAVITEPNKIGRTMVWPVRGYLGVSIRCFMPGSMI
jgi:hypothetical protein